MQNEAKIFGITGDTELLLSHGRKHQVCQQKIMSGDSPVLVYTYNLHTNSIYESRAVCVSSTIAMEIIEVKLGSGAVIRCGRDQEFLMLDGTWKCAKDLQPLDELIAFSRYSNPDIPYLDLILNQITTVSSVFKNTSYTKTLYTFKDADEESILEYKNYAIAISEHIGIFMRSM